MISASNPLKITHVLDAENRIVSTVQSPPIDPWLRIFMTRPVSVPGSAISESKVQSMLDPDGSWREA